MTQKLRILLIFLLLPALALSLLAFQLAPPFFQIDTPGPEVDTVQPENLEPIQEESQAANSDGIVFLGIFIFAIILLPMLILRKEW